MHMRLKFIAPILLLASLVSFTVGVLAAGTTGDARQFVDGVGKRVLSIINSNGNDATKKQKLRTMFEQYVDIPWMGRFVLGHYWQQASTQERGQYLQAYRSYLLARYTNNFANYNGSKYTISGVDDEGNGEFNVSMKIKTPEASQDTLAGYRLIYKNGQFKIHDIIIEGVSLITTQRSEFSSVVQRKGLQGLIHDIENKTNVVGQ